MKNFTFKNVLLFLCLFSLLSISAQEKQKANTPNDIQLTENNQRFLKEHNVIRCYTVENEQALQQKFPNRATTIQFEKSLAPIISKIKEDRRTGKAKLAVYNIPVVVHVLHNGEAVGTAPNITDAQVISQIDVFNEDFRRAIGTPGGANSTGVAVDVEINFCLAQQDAVGNPTNGINRVNVGQDGYSSTGAVDAAKPASQWDPTKYMNMWSVKFIGGASNLLGYAQFPDAAATGVTGIPGSGSVNTDGVVAAYHTFGTADKDDGSFLLNAPYDRGRTMTHEVGHWLGLRHIWGDTGSCTNDDFCADTPDSTTSNAGCPSTDRCPSDGLGNDQVQNYMDYSDDTCMDTFTQDQKDRMQAIMAGSPRRMELNSSIGCQVPSAVTFTLAATPNELTNCGNTSVDFAINMTALNGFNETTTFSASNNPSRSTVSFSPATLNSTSSTILTLGDLDAVTEGVYSITVTGTSASETKNINIALTIGSNVCASVANTTYATGTTRVAYNAIDNTSAKPSGYTDYTSSQSTIVNRESSYNLTIHVNTDGNYLVQTLVWIDWNQDCVFDEITEQYDLGNAANQADGATSISPLSVAVPSDAVLGNTVLRVTSKYSGAIGAELPVSCEGSHDAEVEDYRIIVDTSLGVGENQFNTFSIYPNPSNGTFSLSVSTTKDARVKLFDIRGRNIYSKLHTNNSDVFNVTLDFSSLASGIYILDVESNSKRAVKKIVIQ